MPSILNYIIQCLFTEDKKIVDTQKLNFILNIKEKKKKEESHHTFET